jgi:hypothetical protein
MNIVDQVKINWRKYKVEQGEHRTGESGRDLYGEIAYERQKIYLYDKLGDDEKAVTLLHEIVHGILYFMGSDLASNEGFITGFSENLYQVIKENPDLWREKSGGTDAKDAEREDSSQDWQDRENEIRVTD